MATLKSRICRLERQARTLRACRKCQGLGYSDYALVDVNGEIVELVGACSVCGRQNPDTKWYSDSMRDLVEML